MQGKNYYRQGPFPSDVHNINVAIYSIVTSKRVKVSTVVFLLVEARAEMKVMPGSASQSHFVQNTKHAYRTI